MFRIDSNAAAVSIPVPAAVGSTVGYFSEGNAGTGQLATVVSADWCNAVQEEISGSIETAGLTLDKTSRTQLQRAIPILSAVGSPIIQNMSFSTSVGSNALTVALKTQAAANASSTDVIRIPFRSSTALTGVYVSRTVTAALSVVVSSGSTLGMQSAIAGNLYVYAIDNAGTVELGICNGLLDEGSLQTSIAEGGAGAADSAYILYSTTARSNIAVRLIGRILITEATAGTWASNATVLSLAPFSQNLTAPTTAWVPSTISGFGTVSATSLFYARSGDRMKIQGSFVIGTPSGSDAFITLPTGLSIDTTKIPSLNTNSCGQIWRVGTSASYPNSSYGAYSAVTVSTQPTRIYMSAGGFTSNTFNTTAGNLLSSTAGESIAVNCDVPIAQWAA